MNISTKIWLSISALVLGYLVTVGISSLLGLHAERRLDDTATTLFPATTLSRTAEVAWRGQVQAYQDAVLTGEAEQLTIAATEAKAVQKAFRDLLALHALDDKQRERISGLEQRHATYTGAAVGTYRTLAAGAISDQLTSEAAALDMQAQALHQRFSALVHDFTSDLTGELAQTVARSANQRHASLIVLVVVAGVSITLVFLVISRWTRRLEELMAASERLAQGDFSVAVAKDGHDEIGRLSRSFAAMQAAIATRNDELRRFAEGLEQTVGQRTKELSDRNAELVHEIDERRKAQAEVQELHNQLLDASRRAGMAEVATGVLHNVGNVLNSVNVSANLISEGLRDVRAANVGKAAQLMLEQGEGLARFMLDDPKGRQLPGYLAKLAEHLAAQQGKLITEIGSLLTNVEHIKEIVQLQQSYGRSVGVIQLLPPREVMDEALRLNGSALQRHEVEVVRQYADLPPLPLDRHKILQILVNLISNAKHAIEELKPARRLITLRVEHTADGHLVFTVTDNGIGISAENLKRIFTHGFTTKRDGHGYGLHSCANSAREMGGSMRVDSPGVGQGTTFTLDVPIAKAADRPGAA